MKVRVSLTLEVDEEGWALDYGFETLAAIRADIQTFARSVLAESSDNIRVLR